MVVKRLRTIFRVLTNFKEKLKKNHIKLNFKPVLAKTVNNGS